MFRFSRSKDKGLRPGPRLYTKLLTFFVFFFKGFPNDSRLLLYDFYPCSIDLGNQDDIQDKIQDVIQDDTQDDIQNDTQDDI